MQDTAVRAGSQGDPDDDLTAPDCPAAPSEPVVDFGAAVQLEELELLDSAEELWTEELYELCDDDWDSDGETGPVSPS